MSLGSRLALDRLLTSAILDLVGYIREPGFEANPEPDLQSTEDDHFERREKDFGG